MKPIRIIIPTLSRNKRRADRTAKLALATAGPVDAQVHIAADPFESGYTANVNEGLKHVLPGEDILLLNDDVSKFNYGWLATLQKALYLKDKWGLACPTGNCKSSNARGYIGTPGIVELNTIPFWCALIKAEVYEKLGGLDEEFIHYSSDTWYCYEARWAGWRCIWVKPVYLWHDHEGSGFRHEWRMHDSEVFKKKLTQAAGKRGIFK